MLKFIFYGKVNNKKLALENRAGFIKTFQQFDGKEIELTLSLKTRNRSNNQNRYYWGCVINMIALETGNDPEDIHEALKMKFLKAYPVKLGNDTMPVMPSTIKLNTTEFNNYIEKIRVWAAEQNILIPDPNEVMV